MSVLKIEMLFKIIVQCLFSGSKISLNSNSKSPGNAQLTSRCYTSVENWDNWMNWCDSISYFICCQEAHKRRDTLYAMQYVLWSYEIEVGFHVHNALWYLNGVLWNIIYVLMTHSLLEVQDLLDSFIFKGEREII